jgi:methyl-accepting chemotaxis protein
MTIAQRLYALIFLAAAGLVTLSGISIYQIGKVYTTTNFANTNVIPSLLDLGISSRTFARMRLQIGQYVTVKDASKRGELESAIKDSHAKTIEAFDKYEKEFVANDADKALLAADRSSLAEYDSMRDRVMALAKEDKLDEANELLMANAAIGTKVNDAIFAHNKYNEEIGQKSADDAEATLKSSNLMEIVIAIIVVAGVAGIGLLLVRKLIRSLNEAVTIAQTVAGGDLTGHIEVKSKDEIGKLLQALKEMNESLVKIVGEVRSGTDTISTASSEIANGNLDLSSRTESQASSLEETASSMEELTSTVKQNAANAHQGNQLAQKASEVAIKGGDVVSQVVGTMSSISDSSRKIVDIISVIDGIAFQTNILALNAAVEAARAGEQGRGFAVVAAEVRNLAQRSATAAKEIKTLIGDSVETVELGTKLVDQAGTTMNEVVDSIRHVTNIMGEITGASAEQSRGIEQINQAIIDMDNVTQQNAALVEQAAAAAGAMQDQATKLIQIVGVFKLNGAGHTSHAIGRIEARPSEFPHSRPPSPKIARDSEKRMIGASSSIKPPASVSKVDAADWEEF